jgi:hypothetical protein
MWIDFLATRGPQDQLRLRVFPPAASASGLTEQDLALAGRSVGNDDKAATDDPVVHEGVLEILA